jgi:predicted RNA-binding Zn-ribbon protein involved in translation (DUF1610 family)
MQVGLDTYKELLSTATRRELWERIGAGIGIVCFLLMIPLAVIGLLWRLGIIHLSNLQNFYALLASLAVSFTFVLVCRLFPTFYIFVVSVGMLILYKYGFYTVGIFAIDLATKIVIYLFFALFIINVLHTILANTLPVACPKCHSRLRITTREGSEKIVESYSCPACGWDGRNWTYLGRNWTYLG